MAADYNATFKDGSAVSAGCEESQDSRLRLTVVYTDIEATRSALDTASELAKDLHLQVALVAIQVVPFQLPLDQPQIPLSVLESSLRLLVAESYLPEDEVNSHIYLCRNRRQCLQQVLRPRSLVVLGGTRYWWSEESRLEQWLRRLGHQVMFVDASHRAQATD